VTFTRESRAVSASNSTSFRMPNAGIRTERAGILALVQAAGG
jgi:hypothetical protein